MVLFILFLCYLSQMPDVLTRVREFPFSDLIEVQNIFYDTGMRKVLAQPVVHILSTQ